MTLACPITGIKYDNTIGRLIAAATLLATIAIRGLLAISATNGAFSIAPAVILLIALMTDFGIRAFYRPRYSPLAKSGWVISSRLNLKPTLVDAAPKVFAARIGFLFTISALALLAFGQVAAAGWLLVILGICAMLDAVFSFCVGCWVYAFLPRKMGDALAPERVA